MRRANTVQTVILGASTVLGSTPGVSLETFGELSIHCLIDNGTDGGNPSDSPVGTWQLWVDLGGGVFTRLTSTAITDELAKLVPNTNTAVNAVAAFTGVPGTTAKLLYVRSSGGAASRARLFVQS